MLFTCSDWPSNPQAGCVPLTSQFAVDHDVQVLLRVGADVSGDGVEADGRILQSEAQTGAIEPGQTPEGRNTDFQGLG